MESQLVMSDLVKSTKTARLWLWCTKTNCAVVAIGLLVCRSFTWSMTSWKRGHTCQQRSTTTQPSRPSKARPVPGLQLSLRVNAIIQEGALWFAQLVFFFLIPQGFGSLAAGSRRHTINTARPFLPHLAFPRSSTQPDSTDTSDFILRVPLVVILLFVLRRVCVMFTSLESEAFLHSEGRMVYLWYKKPREANFNILWCK